MPGMGGTTESKPAMAADESFLSKTHIKQTAAKKASVEHGWGEKVPGEKKENKPGTCTESM